MGKEGRMPPVDRMGPVSTRERSVVLDALRGLALFGICLANFPEFSLYTFQSPEVVSAMPTAGIDRVVRFLQYVFIDGKFYSLFSLLFGIGFSIMMSHSMEKGRDGIAVFYRRMGLLALIGLLHLMLLWSGDILLLYALAGLLLPLFRNVPDRKLLAIAAALVFCPVLMDALKVFSGYRFDLAAPVGGAVRYFNGLSGITDANFGRWLVDGEHYSDVLKFTLSGAFIRVQELLESNRVFKVLGLFLLGLYVGRNGIYANLERRRTLLKRVCRCGFLAGLPLSFLYAAHALHLLGGGPVAGGLPVCRQRYSPQPGVCVRFLPVVPSPEGRSLVPGAGGSRADGADQLHRAVRAGHRPVLRNRLPPGGPAGAGAGGTGSCLRLPVPGAVQLRLAEVLPVRPPGMGLAHADVREKAPVVPEDSGFPRKEGGSF